MAFYKELRRGHNFTCSTKSYGEDKIVSVLQRVTESTKLYLFYKELWRGQTCTCSTKSYGEDKIVPVLQRVTKEHRI